MKVSEIFYSLQGEGFLTGAPSVFVRLAGCSLLCRWCDSSYARNAASAEDYSVEEIVDKVLQYPQTRFVVITGGEPMISPQLRDLAAALKKNGRHITIETAGVAFIPDMSCDLMSISPKLSNSMPKVPKLAAIHNKSRLDPACLRRLIDSYEYQLKFVVDSPADLHEITDTIEKIGNVDRSRVLLMPQAASKNELLQKSPMVAEMCTANGFMFCQRLHLLLWDAERGL